MVITYTQDHHIDLLTAYRLVDDVLKDANSFDFDTVKTYIFKHPEIQNS